MTTENSLRGKKNRADGVKFELKVRKDLEAKGWIVDKWSNNVVISEEYCGLCIAKRKYNPHKKVMAIGVGFPDFICFRFIKEEKEVLSSTGTFYPTIKEIESVSRIKLLYEAIGVEAKSNKYLDKEEKAKVKWLLENKIFSKILVAYKGKSGEILYKDER